MAETESDFTRRMAEEATASMLGPGRVIEGSYAILRQVPSRNQ